MTADVPAHMNRRAAPELKGVAGMAITGNATLPLDLAIDPPNEGGGTFVL
jgi:hypothetical protein